MFKLFKNSFNTTNDCIILAPPLIIFMSILGWFCKFTMNGADTVPKIILGGITLLIMTSGFLSAWLYMCKKTIQLSKKIVIFDSDRAKSFGTLILSLSKGIGRLFLPLIGVIGIYIILFGILFFITGFIISNIYPSFDPEILGLHIDQLVTSNEILKGVNKLTVDEFPPFLYWYIITIIGSFILNFITMLWIPEIVYNEKNAFKALFYSLKKNFQNLPQTLILYLYITFLITFVTVSSAVLMFNPFLYFIVLILYYYFLVYIVVLLFSYYEQTFTK